MFLILTPICQQLPSVSLACACMFVCVLQEASDVDPKVWREMAKENIGRSLDASLVILSIVTAPQMPSNVQLEESVEQIISHAKYHLENNIYPEFDPVYRVEARGEDKCNGVRQC